MSLSPRCSCSTISGAAASLRLSLSAAWSLSLSAYPLSVQCLPVLSPPSPNCILLPSVLRLRCLPAFPCTAFGVVAVCKRAARLRGGAAPRSWHPPLLPSGQKPVREGGSSRARRSKRCPQFLRKSNSWLHACSAERLGMLPVRTRHAANPPPVHHQHLSTLFACAPSD